MCSPRRHVRLDLLGALALADAVDGIGINGTAVAIAMVANGAIHGFLDRRWPLEWLVRVTGHGGWLDTDKRALFIYDQVIHILTLYGIAIGISTAS